MKLPMQVSAVQRKPDRNAAVMDVVQIGPSILGFDFSKLPPGLLDPLYPRPMPMPMPGPFFDPMWPTN